MFHTANTDAMRAAGLAGGHVWVSFVEDALELRGDTGGAVRIAASDLDHARIGYIDAKVRRHQTHLWHAGAPEPFVLEPSRATWPAYTRSMLALARSCENAHRLDRIERGSTRFEALFPALLTVPVVIGVLYVEVFVLTEEPWWVRTLLPLIPLVLFGFLLRRGLAAHWPTRLAPSDDLLPILPRLTWPSSPADERALGTN